MRKNGTSYSHSRCCSARQPHSLKVREDMVREVQEEIGSIFWPQS